MKFPHKLFHYAEHFLITVLTLYGIWDGDIKSHFPEIVEGISGRTDM